MAKPSAERVLVTGGTGGLGQVLLPLLVARGFEVSALYRSSHPDMPEVEWLQGDVTAPGLGLGEGRRHFRRLYHVAGLVSLTDRDRAELLRVNTTGTLHAVLFCQQHRVPRLFHVSTAYVDRMERGQPPRNAYEMSKFRAEAYVREAAHDPGPPFNRFRRPLKVTIFRPSVLLPAPGTKSDPQGFLLYAHLLLRIGVGLHRRAELLRRKLEGLMRLPPLEPCLRIRGDPHGTLNIVPTEWVAQKIAETDAPGTYWLTHANPPKLQALVDWIGELFCLRIEFKQEFRASPPELLLQRLAGAFQPYLTDTPDLPCSFADCSPWTRELIQNILTDNLLKG